MKAKIGQYCLYIGTIGGAISGARIPPNWTVFTLFFIVLVVGIVLKKVGKKGVSVEAKHSVVKVVEESLRAIVTKIENLNKDKSNLTNESLHEKINEIVTNEVFNFSENRHSITETYGINGYNKVMGAFAIGERYINRVWSATTDGYLEEALIYLDRAVPEFKEAQRVLNDLIME